MIRKYFINILISIDQFGNALTGGDPDETISSRCGKLVRSGKRGFAFWLCMILHKMDRNHCMDAIEEDEGDDAVHGRSHVDG